MAAADLREVERMIVTTGFFRQKTKSLTAAAQDIVDALRQSAARYVESSSPCRGRAQDRQRRARPRAREARPGGRTHVRRLSLRLGLTRSGEPEVIEQDLCAILPPSDWTPFSMRLICTGARSARRASPDASNARCGLIVLRLE